jgi:dienelactone hydrolase
VQLHYGLQDQHIPRQEIEAVTDGVRGCSSAEVFLYPQAGHSFANPVRPTYDAAATRLAATRIERMLEELSG